jgi:hypothetical protein
LKLKVKGNWGLPEGSVAVELNVQAHEEKGGGGEDSLTQPQSQASAGAQCPWQLVHAIIACMQGLVIVNSNSQRL